MRIGAVATATQVNEHTLRYYEKEGLIQPPARSANGYREYPDDTVAVVRFIKRAQELGFSLDDAKALLSLRTAPGQNRLKVRELAITKVRDVEQRLADLSAIRSALLQLVNTCCQNEEPRCPILEALDTAALPIVHSSPPERNS